MSQDNKQTTIADVLQTLAYEAMEKGVESRNGYIYEPIDKMMPEALHLIEQLVAEGVIGEDEKYNDTYEPDRAKAEYKIWQNGLRVHRNDLRDEQRLALHDVVYGAEEKK